MIAFLKLSRPVFLGGGVLLYALGAAAAHGAGARIDWRRYLLGQALVTTVQLATQYANEYFDLEADAANPYRTWLSGGSGVLPAGLLAPEVALRAALTTATAALGLAAALVVFEPVVAIIGVVALLGGWSYSAPPLRLAGSGFGEAAASLIVAALTPAAGALMQWPTAPAELWLPVAALVLAHVAMLLALHMPDVAPDQAVGKRTLAVRLGPGRARWLIVAVLAAAAVIAGVSGTWWATIALAPGIAFTAVVLARPGAHRLLTTSAVATFATLAVGFLLAAS